MGQYVLCPGGCGKKFISLAHAEHHADIEHPDWRKPKVPMAKGWGTPWGFIDFEKPVTYEQACEKAKAIFNAVKDKL